MKVKSDYLLRDVGSQHLVVPVGKETRSFRGFVRLNDTGAYLWGLLKQDMTPEGLVDALVQRYGVDEEHARTDVDAFLRQISKFLEA